MPLIGAIVLCLLVAVGWVLTLLGLPGNWLIVAAGAAYARLVPSESSLDIGWQPIVALAVLAVVGELVELLAAACGVSRVGGSRRSAVLALVGSITGGIVGMFVGLPIPIVGSLVAAVLFAGVGALAGAMIGEEWKGRDFEHSWEVGKAAFWGRLAGTLGKTLIASVMVVVAIGALVF